LPKANYKFALLEIGNHFLESEKEIITIINKSNNPIEDVKGFLSRGWIPNMTNEYGESLVQYLIRLNCIDHAEILINNGADINKPDTYYNNTPLVSATIRNLPNIVELILNKGADITKQNNNGSTPAYLAVKNKLSNIAELLTNKRSNPNTPQL